MTGNGFESRTGYSRKSLHMQDSDPCELSRGHRKEHRVIRTSTLVFVLFLGLALYPTEGRTHTGSHRVSNWHRWERVAQCETRGVTNRWEYGPRHPYALRHGWSGYWSGLQMRQAFWDRARARFKYRRYRRIRRASQAPKWLVIRAAEMYRKHYGTGAWPHCRRYF